MKCQASKQTVQKAAAAVTSLPALLAANPAFALVSVMGCNDIFCQPATAPGPLDVIKRQLCCDVVEPPWRDTKAGVCPSRGLFWAGDVRSRWQMQQ